MRKMAQYFVVASAVFLVGIAADEAGMRQTSLAAAVVQLFVGGRMLVLCLEELFSERSGGDADQT